MRRRRRHGLDVAPDEPLLVAREITPGGAIWWGPFVGIDAVIEWCEATGAVVEPVALVDPGERR